MVLSVDGKLLQGLLLDSKTLTKKVSGIYVPFEGFSSPITHPATANTKRFGTCDLE